MRKPILLTAVFVFAAAGLALATTITSTLTPNAPGKGSELMVTAGPFPPATSAPKSLTVTLQSGFSTSTAKRSSATYRRGWADSTPVLCTTAELDSEDCAGAAPRSRIGQGTAQITVGGSPLFSGTIPVVITMFLGQPPAGGCPAEVEINFQIPSSSPVLAGQSQAANGTLCRHAGGLELSFANLPFSGTTLPSGMTATLDSVQLSAGASQRIATILTRRRRRHGRTLTKTVTRHTRANLLNNPGSCPASGQWTGTLTVDFGSGPQSQALSFGCSP